MRALRQFHRAVYIHVFLIHVGGGFDISKEARSLQHYILKRILEGILVVFVVIILTFLLIHAAPGSPATFLAGEYTTPEFKLEIEHEFGLDQPIYTQLFIYLGRVLQGNFGYSYSYQQSVLGLIAERLGATLLLMLGVVILSAVVGVFLGVIAAIKAHSLGDNLLSIGALIGNAMPSFWSGQILVLVFALYLRWLPGGGYMSLRVQYTGLAYYADILYHSILPIANLSLIYLALIFRMTRASMLDNLNEDHITTARAKGLPERTVLFKHALRNALLPVVSVIGNNFSRVLGGAIVTETIFAWPGIGRLVADSIYSRDYPVLMGVFIVVAVMVVVVNLITDIVYAYIDPRIRYK